MGYKQWEFCHSEIQAVMSFILSILKNLDSSVAFGSLRMTKNGHKLTAANYHPASDI